MMQMDISFPGGAKVDAAHNGFTIHTDQDVKSGGDNSAPTPYALFLASLATCSGLYVLRFCETRKIPTEGLGLKLIAEPRADGKGMAVIGMDIKLPPEFPAKYEKAVIRAAELCAVKKTIVDPPEMTIAVSR